MRKEITLESKQYKLYNHYNPILIRMIKKLYGSNMLILRMCGMGKLANKVHQVIGHKIDKFVFNDHRSKKVVFLAHCILNQNARMKAHAYWRTGVKPIIQFLEEREIGIVQMPCPELTLLGLGRDGQIYKQLSDPQIKSGLRKMAKNICYQIAQYRKYGFMVLAVIGIDGSPSCGVTKTWDGHGRYGEGKFIIEFKDELKKQNIDIVLKGFEDNNISEALNFLKALVQE